MVLYSCFVAVVVFLVLFGVVVVVVAVVGVVDVVAAAAAAVSVVVVGGGGVVAVVDVAVSVLVPSCLSSAMRCCLPANVVYQRMVQTVTTTTSAITVPEQKSRRQ